MAKGSATSLDTLREIPKPRKAGSKKLAVAAFFAVVLVGALAFWWTRPPEVQDRLKHDAQALREEAAQMVDDATKGTPLAGSGRFLREAPPPPPAQILHPPTNSGTLAGPVIRGQSGLEGMLLPDGTFRKANQPVVEKVREDSHLKRRFVDDLAAYIVHHYTPDARGGRLALSVQSLNQYCGMRLNTEGSGGRAAFMRYAFHPAMLNGLYNLYVDAFLNTLTSEAEKEWDQRAVASFYALLAERLEHVSAAMGVLLRDASLDASLTAYEKLAEECEAISAQHTVALFDLDQLQEKKASAQEIKAQRLRVDGLGTRYRMALEKRDNALRTMLEPYKHTLAGTVDDESLLFLSLWMRRRLANGNGGREGIETSRAILGNLSSRLTALATGEKKEKESAEKHREEANPSTLKELLPSGERTEKESGQLGGASLVEETSLVFPADADLAFEEKKGKEALARGNSSAENNSESADSLQLNAFIHSLDEPSPDAVNNPSLESAEGQKKETLVEPEKSNTPETAKETLPFQPAAESVPEKTPGTEPKTSPKEPGSESPPASLAAHNTPASSLPLAPSSHEEALKDGLPEPVQIPILPEEQRIVP